MQSAQVLARWTARTERVSSHQLHHEPRAKRSERGVQLMASDKATQYPANGFSFRGLTSYLANNHNTQTNNDFSSPVAESSAADRPRAPAALGERESVNGYLQRLYRQRAQPLRDVHSGGVPACVWHAVGSNSQSPIPSRFCGPCNARRELPVRPLPALEIAQGRLGTTPKQTRTTRASKRQNLRRGGTT